MKRRWGQMAATLALVRMISVCTHEETSVSNRMNKPTSNAAFKRWCCGQRAWATDSSPH